MQKKTKWQSNYILLEIYIALKFEEKLYYKLIDLQYNIFYILLYNILNNFLKQNFIKKHLAVLLFITFINYIAFKSKFRNGIINLCQYLFINKYNLKNV